LLAQVEEDVFPPARKRPAESGDQRNDEQDRQQSRAD
jgi:hypothetical protein